MCSSDLRAYTILASWPEKDGAQMEGNEHGGRKEATGVWAWKLETLEPGETFTLTYSLSGLEKGDWTDTDVFYRGSQEVIGATKMDEKLLEEIRRQEAMLTEQDVEDEEGEFDENDGDDGEEAVQNQTEEEPRPSGQQTLMGYGGDD